MLSERLFGGGDDEDLGTEAASIADMDERYADVVELLHTKPEHCLFLAVSSDGLHFWLNFDGPDDMTDFLSGLAVAVHDRVMERHGIDAADATIARIFADTISESV
jgi:hypothetical protein